MGSLCCVAARPHGSQRGCANWSVGPNESHCLTNRSFSPPLSRRWDYRFHSEAVSSGSHGLQFYESPLSSTSKGSRSRISSSGHISNHQYSASDGSVSNFNSPSDSFHAQHWDTMAHGINLGEFVSATMSEPRFEPVSHPLLEGWPTEETSTIHYDEESSSSYSDAGDLEQSCIVYIPSAQYNYSGQYPFVSKPGYPIIYTGDTSYGSSSLISTEDRNSSRWCSNNVHHAGKKSFVGFSEVGSMQGCADNGSCSQRPHFRWNSASCLDFGLHLEILDQAGNTSMDNLKLSSASYEDVKCALCERWLLQKSPWSSKGMVMSGDMPVAGVLSCSHVYHAECLDQTTPKSQKHDPICPLCAGGFKLPLVSNSNESLPFSELQPISTPPNEFQMFKITADDGSSSGNQNCVQSEHIADGSGRKWGVEIPLQNSKSFLSKTRLRKHFSFKGKSVKELPVVELGPKGAGCRVQVYPDHVPVGCSRKAQYL